MKLLILALAMVTLVAAKPKLALREADIQELKELLLELNEEKKEQAEIPYDAPHYKISTKRSLYKRTVADCANICKPVHLPSDKKEECSTKFAPEYEVLSGCECLKDYRCCPKECKPVDMNTCNVTTKGFGYFYPSKPEPDCCGCEVVQCNPCEPPIPKVEQCADKQFGDECYRYTMESYHSDVEGCFQSICPIKKDPAHPPPPCDTNCMTVTDGVDECGFKFDTCEDSSNICALEEKIPTTLLGVGCYDISSILSTGYKHVGEGDCEQCTELEATKKSCAVEDKAAEDLNCHKFGASGYDKKCWTKTWDQDSCECATADCEAKGEVCQETFAPDEVCPAGHKKKKGVAICGQAREICIACPSTHPTCDKYESLVDAIDADGCAIKRCKTVIVDNTGSGCGVEEYFVTADAAGIFTVSCHEDHAAVVDESETEEDVLPPS